METYKIHKFKSNAETVNNRSIKCTIKPKSTGGGGTCFDTSWQPKHSLHFLPASLSIPGHQTFDRRRSLVFTIPWCPSWAKSNTLLCNFFGTTILDPRTRPGQHKLTHCIPAHRLLVPVSNSLSSMPHAPLSILHLDMCLLSLQFEGQPALRTYPFEAGILVCRDRAPAMFSREATKRTL